MRTVVIVQARMGSTRLPGKTLRPIAGKSMLAHVVDRVKRAENMDEVVVATTTKPADDAIVAECTKLGVRYFRGSEDDVLDRYYQTAVAFDAAVVVRITSDCPLIDPEIIDKLIAIIQAQDVDYVSNALTRSFPRGLDAEVFKLSALRRAYEQANQAYQRVHVTPYIYQHPNEFALSELVADADYSMHRWTVDTLADWELITAIYTHFALVEDFSWQDVLAYVQAHPELSQLNAHIEQKKLREG